MAAHDPSKHPGAPPRRKSAVLRYIVSLVLLVVIIGGIAWVGQYLPSWKKAPPLNQQTEGKTLLQFTRVVAQWGPKPDLEPGVEEKPTLKEVETGNNGHYDFPFKNVSKEDVEIVFYSSSCNCASVQACAVSSQDWDSVNSQHLETPAEPLTYPANTTWHELKRDIDWTKLTTSEKNEHRLVIKPGDGGAIRVQWIVKAGGSTLIVTPRVWFQSARGSDRVGQQLGVPVLLVMPVRFQPSRNVVGALTAGTATKAEFYAWSSTRDQFDLKLSATANDALFDVDMKPVRVGGVFSRSECADLHASFDPKAIPTVRCAQRVTVTIHESRGGQYLDLGSFHRKLAVFLDGRLTDVPGPEIAGRVHGEISIGGSDDQGKIRFKSFSGREGAIKTVELAADPSWKLEPFKHEPAWITVNLTRAAKQEDPKRATWRLVVTVPENTPGVRSLEDPDAVILRIVGPPERMVRIPIEGHMSGR